MAGVLKSVTNLNAKLALLCIVAMLATAARLPGTDIKVLLDREWRFALDREDDGLKEEWFKKTLTDRIELPGILQTQGYGDEISIATPWVLSLYDKSWFLREDYRNYTNPGRVKVPFVCQPPRHYLGAAWYQRDVEIPAGWAGKRIGLFLERAHWETRVWLDDQLLGTNNSLCAPHEYELGRVEQGRHRLSIRVDNRMLMAYRPDAHAVSDSLGSTWNGIVGKIELQATPLVWIGDAQVFPDVTGRSMTVRGELGNSTGRAGQGKVVLNISPLMANRAEVLTLSL